MFSIESLTWKDKVSEPLMNRYIHAIGSNEGILQRVMLYYQGDFRRFPDEIEVLSVIDGWVQVQIPMAQLPNLASMNEVLSMSLHAYLQPAS